MNDNNKIFILLNNELKIKISLKMPITAPVVVVLTPNLFICMYFLINITSNTIFFICSYTFCYEYPEKINIFQMTPYCISHLCK